MTEHTPPTGGEAAAGAPEPTPPAERLASHLEPAPTGAASALRPLLAELASLDAAVYRAIAVTPTPMLDDPIRRLSSLADHSKLWVAAAAVLAVAGGRRGRRAAATGLAAVAVNSLVVNVPLKLAARRERPDRVGALVPLARQVPMPRSPSFPSGHSASAFAFASAVGGSMPLAAAPLRSLAAVVGYSRVHTGVHYPGDVIIGALIGSTIGEAVAALGRVRRRRIADRTDPV
jgi:undecaprenyl-diphosphatase